MLHDFSMNRRSFFQAGATIGATLALGAEGQEDPAAPVRIGIVGTGNRGTFHAKLLSSMPGVEVRAVCDVVPERAEKAAALVEEGGHERPATYTNGDHDYENLVARDDLDAVLTATPWEWHTRVMVAAMRAGKYGATEVPAAMTMDECWDLVKTSEETGMPCMMLENVNYFQNVLTIMRMVREGTFGEMLHCEAGYQHDTRYLAFEADGVLHWRGEHARDENGNVYPTHPIGPIAWWMNINRGDRFDYLVSMSTPSHGLREMAAHRFGPDHELANIDYKQGDVNTTLIKTAKGKTITLYYDCGTPRPYDLIFRVQGTKGIYMGNLDKIYLEGVSPTEHAWEEFAPYNEKYAHPLWTDLSEKALESGGHGGADYITLHEFIKAVRNKTQTPQDVYDAAAWSAIVPLSIQSVANGSQPATFPDFTKGKWETSKPVVVKGA